MTLMQGPALLRARTVQYLSSTMPAIINLARTQWGLTALQLPYPIKYDAADPYHQGPDQYPLVGMYLVSDRDHIHRDFSGAAEREYWSIYSCRMFVSVITPKDSAGEYVNVHPYEETIRTRDNLRTVLVNALLQSPSMGGQDVEILEETISTDYDEPMQFREKSHNFTAAAVVNVDIRMTESLFLPPLGTAETTAIEVVRVPEGEPL